MHVTQGTAQKRGTGLLGQEKNRHEPGYTKCIVLVPNSSLQYVNDSYYVLSDRTPFDMCCVNPQLYNVQFTKTVVPRKAMELRKYDIAL